MSSVKELSIGDSESATLARPERGYLVYMLVLLALVNVSSYMDRSVLAALAPQIKAELGISDTLWGAVAGVAFAIPYAIASVPLAILADRWSRRGRADCGCCDLERDDRVLRTGHRPRASAIACGVDCLIVGYPSDQFAPWAGENSLTHALLVSTAFCLWPVLHFLLAARTIGADVAGAK